MMALLLEPLQFTFMSHALLISLVVSIPCALLSVFLVLKGWALMGDAMSHAVLPGAALGFSGGTQNLAICSRPAGCPRYSCRR